MFRRCRYDIPWLTVLQRPIASRCLVCCDRLLCRNAVTRASKGRRSPALRELPSIVRASKRRASIGAVIFCFVAALVGGLAPRRELVGLGAAFVHRCIGASPVSLVPGRRIGSPMATLRVWRAAVARRTPAQPEAHCTTAAH